MRGRQLTGQGRSYAGAWCPQLPRVPGSAPSKLPACEPAWRGLQPLLPRALLPAGRAPVSGQCQYPVVLAGHALTSVRALSLVSRSTHRVAELCMPTPPRLVHWLRFKRRRWGPRCTLKGASDAPTFLPAMSAEGVQVLGQLASEIALGVGPRSPCRDPMLELCMVAVSVACSVERKREAGAQLAVVASCQMSVAATADAFLASADRFSFPVPAECVSCVEAACRPAR